MWTPGASAPGGLGFGSGDGALDCPSLRLWTFFKAGVILLDEVPSLHFHRQQAFFYSNILPQGSVKLANQMANQRPLSPYLWGSCTDHSHRQTRPPPWYRRTTAKFHHGTLQGCTAVMPTPPTINSISWTQKDKQFVAINN